MITNNELIKLFVRVPSSVKNFNGTTVSGAEGETRLFFEEATGKIWAKGHAYGGSASGGLTQEQVQALINSTLALTDEDTTINKISEVIDWFNNLPEGDAGALALINLVGKPTEYYTAADEQENSEHVAGTVKTAATGLYALVEQNAAGISTNAAAITAIETEIGTKAVKYTQAEADSYNANLTGAVAAGAAAPSDYETKVGTAAGGATLTAEEAAAYNATLSGAKTTESIETASTGIYKYVDDELSATEQVTAAALNDLNTRVTSLEGFNPWQEYSAS